MKRILSFIIITAIFVALLTENIVANDEEDMISTEVISQSEYEGYKLEWERYDQALFDLLLKVTYNDNVIAEYSYNEDNNRIFKFCGSEKTSFTYTSDYYLDTVSNKYGTIQYLYSFKEFSNVKFMTGFLYNGKMYEFVYDENGIIVGISYNEEKIAEYIYDVDYTFLKTMKKNGQGWIECEDEEFIGNINKIRFVQVYYDEETGWYYFGRYYDTKNERYLDGISANIYRTIDNIGDKKGY